MLCGGCDAAALQKWYFYTWCFSCPLVVVLNINIRICIHWKRLRRDGNLKYIDLQGLLKQTSADLGQSSTSHYYLVSVEKWIWVAGITWKTLHWHWLNGRYYMKNKLVPGETWQIELWSWPRTGGERDWGKFNDTFTASVSIKSAKCCYCRTLL